MCLLLLLSSVNYSGGVGSQLKGVRGADDEYHLGKKCDSCAHGDVSSSAHINFKAYGHPVVLDQPFPQIIVHLFSPIDHAIVSENNEITQKFSLRTRNVDQRSGVLTTGLQFYFWVVSCPVLLAAAAAVCKPFQ